MSNGVVYAPVVRDGVPITRIETISSGAIDLSRIGYAERTTEIEKHKMHPGDILYSHINSIDHIGKVALFSGGYELFHGMNLLLLRCSDSVNPVWLYHLLNSAYARKWAKTIAKQAVSQTSINTKELRSLLIPTPDQTEQQAIATILSDMNAEIGALERRCDKTKLIKQGMMQQLLTGRIRLVNPQDNEITA